MAILLLSVHIRAAATSRRRSIPTLTQRFTEGNETYINLTQSSSATKSAKVASPIDPAWAPHNESNKNIREKGTAQAANGPIWIP